MSCGTSLWHKKKRAGNIRKDLSLFYILLICVVNESGGVSFLFCLPYPVVWASPLYPICDLTRQGFDGRIASHAERSCTSFSHIHSTETRSGPSFGIPVNSRASCDVTITALRFKPVFFSLRAAKTDPDERGSVKCRSSTEFDLFRTTEGDP